MKILVRGTNWIGDSVMTVPALRALRAVFPDAEIVLCTRALTEGVFRDADFIDRILPIENSYSSLFGIFREASRLRREKFNMAIILPNSFASALAVRLAGIPRRFGYSKDMRWLLLTDPIVIPAWKDTRHEVFYYRELIKAVESCVVGASTLYDTDPSSSLAVSSTRKDEAREFLRQQGVDFSRPVIAVGAGSTNSVAKRWPAERFARVAELLQREFHANIILLGSGGDKIVSDEVANLLIFKPIDLTGKTSIADAVSILSVANLLISNDIGLAHVAPAVGTRTVVIFGPTNPVTTRPFSPLAEVVRHEVECSPCMLRECPIDHRCMTRVTVEQVFDVAKSLLGKNDEN